MNPEFYDYIMDRLFKAGVLDVYFTPIQMKKNRPAVKLSVLVTDSVLDDAVSILLEESTTIGVRVFNNIERFCLKRDIEFVLTPWGKVKVKVAVKDGEAVNISPEYDSCRKIAEENEVPLEKVYRQAKYNYEKQSR